jgi:hypothetical protein
VPIAFNGSVVPNANNPLAGVIASDTNAGAPTVSVADPLIVPEVAVIVALPCPAPDAKPEPLTVATVGDEEVQVAEVRFCVLPSV